MHWLFKSKEQKSAIKNIKTLYELREKVIEWFNDYSKLYLKLNIKQNICNLFSPKQILQRLSLALAQVKAGNTSEKSLMK